MQFSGGSHQAGFFEILIIDLNVPEELTQKCNQLLFAWFVKMVLINRALSAVFPVGHGNNGRTIRLQTAMNIPDSGLKIAQVLQHFEADDERKPTFFKRKSARICLNNLRLSAGFLTCRLTRGWIVFHAQVTAAFREKFLGKGPQSGSYFQNTLVRPETRKHEIITVSMQCDLQAVVATFDIKTFECHRVNLKIYCGGMQLEGFEPIALLASMIFAEFPAASSLKTCSFFPIS